MEEYKPNLEDQIDWKIIDQLHSATSSFSNSSIELKKMFLIVIGISIPATIKLNGDTLDLSLFVIIYIITITFWYLDAYTFFYQESLRAKMDLRFEKIQIRNKKEESHEGDNTEELDQLTLENDRTKETRWRRSFTNSSARMYHLFLIFNSIALFFFLITLSI